MRTIAFPLIAAGLAAALLVQTAPARAGGMFSFNIAPSNPGDQQLLSTGMHLYSLYRGFRGGSIEQYGQGNSAGLSQRGHDNIGFIQQRGRGHSATLEQTGNDNAWAIFQYGRNADNRVVQNGNGGAGATFSYGW
ncbi:curlin [Rhizobium paknamense]|uniref:Major curlin subunit n=1 Tax=Rhizobium paknamense TaxID=1206817 RepID=A0ABU0IAD7_9HYPH|nr:curlin [Rhizobium paknamense]MDQ0455189.1 major curlin subunit [Rhizobium paknamense]